MKPVLVILHALSEPLGALAGPIAAAGLRTETRLASVSLPASVADYSALVVMGGTMAVYEADRYPSLSAEIGLLREALAAGMPTLGVCLGSQLLAAAGGARVYRGPGPEVGWAPVTRVADDPWLVAWPQTFEPLHWHGDTFELPTGAIHLASSERYPNQAFRLGSGLGLQFHVEATAAMARQWMLEAHAVEEASRGEEAAFRMAPLVAALGRAFAGAVTHRA